jgi:hypothetical protein
VGIVPLAGSTICRNVPRKATRPLIGLLRPAVVKKLERVNGGLFIVRRASRSGIEYAALNTGRMALSDFPSSRPVHAARRVRQWDLTLAEARDLS